MFANVTFLYFLLLIPLSGFIAWIGDRIGHKSGKRRHSLFGLRPRHTAMLFTIGTGMCISLLSFGLVWAISESFRVVVRDGAALVQTNRDLQQDNTNLSANIERLRGKETVLRQKAQESQGSAAQWAQEAGKADHRRDVAAAKAEAAEVRSVKAEIRLNAETKRLTAAQSDREAARRSLSEIQGRLGDQNVQLKRVAQRLAEADRQVADYTRRVQDAQKQSTDAEANLARVRRDADAALQVQKKALDDQKRLLAELTQQLQDKNAEYAAESGKFEQQRTALASLNQQVASSKEELRQISDNIGALRGHRITYQVGQEVDRVAIRSGYSIWRVEAVLQSFLSTAAKRAEENGAGKARELRSVVILPRFTGDGAGSDGTVAREDNAVRAAATAIREANTDVVVVANATANAVAGEPVPIEFHIYRNPVVLTANQQVGEAAIDGNGSRQAIADALYNFLHQDIRRSLLKAGIIPPFMPHEITSTGRNNPSVSVGGSDAREENLIRLSGDEWLQLLDKVREMGSQARVVAKASKDLRAGDAPVLRFEVRGAFNSVSYTTPTSTVAAKIW